MKTEQIARDNYNKEYSQLKKMGDPISMNPHWERGNRIGYSVNYGYQSNFGTNEISIDKEFLTPENITKYEITKYHIDKFGLRHFDLKFSGTKILDMTSEDFEYYLMGNIDIQKMKLIDSDMDFCKYLIIPNFTKAKSGSYEISMNNYQYLRTGYSARREGELPILSRWFEFPIEMPPAKYLQIVLYSKDQMTKESQARNEEIDPNLTDWNIIAILGQNSGVIEPMTPATMMRNSLGMEEGGNGHKLNREKYQESVDFWSKMATVK
jgi:hypothetical protein